MPGFERTLTLVSMSFWDLVAQYRDETGASEAWIMRRAGLDKGTFTAWRARGIPALPKREHLEGLASTLRVDYSFLLNVVLEDVGYGSLNDVADDFDEDLQDQPADEVAEPIHGETPQQIAARERKDRQT